MPWREGYDPVLGRTMFISPYPGGPPEKVGPIRDVWVSPSVLGADGITRTYLDLFVGNHPYGDVTQHLPGALWLPYGDIFGRPEYLASFITEEGTDHDGPFITTRRDRPREQARLRELKRLRASSPARRG